MATVVPPVRGSGLDFGAPHPNVATAGRRLPAVRDFAQVDREIRDTLHPTVGWFLLLAVAVTFLLIGIATWFYQIHEGLGVAGYEPPTMWAVYIVCFVFWVGI